MQFSLEQLLVDFEEAFGCTLTLQDPMHLLGSLKSGRLAMERFSHRRSFPEMCGTETREYCTEHCMFQFNKWADKTRRPVYFMHCKNGFWQLAVPIYRDNIHVLNMFAGMWRHFEDRKAIRRLARMLPVFADGLYRLLERQLEANKQPPNTMAGHIHSFIADNYNRPLQTRELARHLSLSVSRTCAVVQKECRATFKELLNLERLRHAKLYLVQTDMRIKEIALLCGFASPEHFLRTFRAYEKSTPAKWRATRP